jgi:hypothetical protein
VLTDKKVHAGKIGWVLPASIGKTRWGVEAPWRIVDRSFRVLPEIIDGWQRNETRFAGLHKT